MSAKIIFVTDQEPSSQSLATHLILDCLSLNDHQGGATLFSGATSADWGTFLELAEQNQVAALVYQQIQKHQLISEFPELIIKELRQSYHSNILDNLSLSYQVGQILTRLHETGVPAIPLKGIYLAEKVYTNIGVRTMRDIDLLVPRRQLTAALAILYDQGFKSQYTFDIDRECQVMHHLPTLQDSRKVSIDLHWTLAPPKSPFAIPIDQVWERSQPSTLSGVPCLAVAPEDFLLHLCIHATYMEYFTSGLRPFCDLAWTVHVYRSQIDWEKFIQQAHMWGALRSAWLALMVTCHLLHVTIPSWVTKRLLPFDANQAMIEWAAMQVLNPTDIGGKLAAVLAPNPWHRRAGLFMRQLFPPPHEMRVFYKELAHGAWWPLAYLKHLQIVFARNWLPAWRLARGNPQSREEVIQRNRVNELVRWIGNG